ncbi:HTH-type transcriptional regulator nfxB [Ectopseudomonas oleovorans CECT 5344]|uniref:HTH-type transcriptional regulator nfxB n=2 Tax=Ectopseudomonas oleovorans TaxID=301 RepID=W6QVB7_ECTO5|nr:HTH-type transcriptional regulator nfxB [Pseudomonas oleovorans CECT 5344]
MIFQYRPDSLDPDQDGARWIAYTDALDSFFLRGQQEGYFRIDITAELLTELFVSLIYGMVDAERRGRAASARSLAVLEQFFLKGAGQPRA